jgi:ribonuclease BN (tRNA processing enzyme)
MKADMRITLLGSGTCVPSLKRSACSVLVQAGRSNIVLDTGPGTLRQLLKAGVSIFDISHVFYSHFHPDHSAELVSLLFATKYPDASRRRFALTLGAGVGFQKLYSGLRSVYGSWIELAPGMLNIIELSTATSDAIDFDDFTIRTSPVAHNAESIAFRITGRGGASVVYSGDTDTCEDLVRLAREADVLICESAMPDGRKVRGHLTPSAAGEIATRAKVDKLVLTHFYPECDTVDVESQCRRTYDGPLLLAEDLMTIELPAARHRLPRQCLNR